MCVKEKRVPVNRLSDDSRHPARHFKGFYLRAWARAWSVEFIRIAFVFIERNLHEVLPRTLLPTTAGQKKDFMLLSAWGFIPLPAF